MSGDPLPPWITPPPNPGMRSLYVTWPFWSLVRTIPLHVVYIRRIIARVLSSALPSAKASSMRDHDRESNAPLASKSGSTACRPSAHTWSMALRIQRMLETPCLPFWYAVCVCGTRLAISGLSRVIVNHPSQTFSTNVIRPIALCRDGSFTSPLPL